MVLSSFGSTIIHIFVLMMFVVVVWNKLQPSPAYSTNAREEGMR